MSASGVDIIKEIYRRSISAVHPSTVIPSTVRLDADGWLHVGELRLKMAAQPVYSLAIGKAAGEMTAALETILHDQLAGSLVVTKSLDPDLTLRARVLVGSHPVPDERSLKAGDEVLRFAAEAPEGAVVLCMISGGGSALVEALQFDITLDALQETTRALLRAGASIHELNAVRARMSRLKAGGLLEALRHTTVVNLIISDVLGDDLSTIASGPTVPAAQLEPAEDVLRRYSVSQDLPAPAGRRERDHPETLIVASLGKAIDAAVQAADEHGFQPVILTRSLTGEARQVATAVASIVADSATGQTTFPRGSCLIAGGETTVTVQGTGVGGRNTEAALAAALRLHGVENVAIGFLATDGDDGVSGAAGAIVTGETLDADDVQDARKALDDNDSWTYLHECGATWETSGTGTNVNDLIIALVL